MREPPHGHMPLVSAPGWLVVSATVVIVCSPVPLTGSPFLYAREIEDMAPEASTV